MEISGEIKRFRNTYAARFRIEYPKAVYHLIHRAPGKEVLFHGDDDYRYFLYLLKKTSHDFSWEVFCFVLMKNHIHILLRIAKENLSEGAMALFGNYARYFNAKYQRKGPVFSKPFRAFLCLDDPYLLCVSLYIHLNPYKAGVVKSPVEYRWSTLPFYLSEPYQDAFVDYEFVLKLLNSDLKMARKIYYKLIYDNLDVEYHSVFDQPDFIRKFYLIIGARVSNIAVFEKCNQLITILKQRWPSLALDDKRHCIEVLLKKGYNKKEIADLLSLSRMQIYRILKY